MSERSAEEVSPEAAAEDEVTRVDAAGSTVADRSVHLSAAEGAVLRADEVVAGYLPGINILNGCDLYVQPGELVGIIGPNGAGKSTLLKSLFGLVKVRQGVVTLKGEDITGLKANKLVSKGVGYVPRPTTSSRASPSRRTSRWGSIRRRAGSPTASSS